MEQFRNIGVIGREGNGVIETLGRLLAFLEARNLKVVLDQELAQLVPVTQPIPTSGSVSAAAK